MIGRLLSLSVTSGTPVALVTSDGECRVVVETPDCFDASVTVHLRLPAGTEVQYPPGTIMEVSGDEGLARLNQMAFVNDWADLVDALLELDQ